MRTGHADGWLTRSADLWDDFIDPQVDCPRHRTDGSRRDRLPQRRRLAPSTWRFQSPVANYRAGHPGPALTYLETRDVATMLDHELRESSPEALRDGSGFGPLGADG